MKRLTIAVALFCGIAAADTFPDADGSHDISSVTAWDGTIPLSAAFGAPDVTYTAGADVQFGAVEVKEGNTVFDFSETPGRVVTITNKGNCAFWLSGCNSSLELKGAKWYFPNNGIFSVGKPGDSSYGTNSTVTLSGGCIVTNAGGFTIASYGNVDSKFVVKDGAFFHMVGDGGHVTYMSDKRSGASMEIIDGGRFYVDGYFWVDGGGSADPPINTDVSMLVSGTGSHYGSTAGLYLGSKGHNASRVTFTDHASGDIGGVVSLGYNNPSGGHVFTVEDGATLNCGSVAIGHNTTEHILPNRVDVLGGATLTVANTLYVGNANNSQRNELFVSNATVVCKKFLVGPGAQSYGNRAVFFGPDTHLQLSSDDSFNLFGNTSSGNEIIFDGVTWEHTTSKNGIYFSLGANTGNLVRVTNGGTIRTDKTFHIGYSNDFSNRVEVLNGGKLEVTDGVVELKRHGQTLVVSNGTLICKTFNIGGYQNMGIGNRFMLMGENATFTETARSGTYPLIYSGMEGEILVSDGAVWSYDLAGVYTSIGNGVTNNTIRIARGGHFNVANGLFIGYKGDQGNGFSVEDGGFVDCKSLTIGADSQWLAISNGTVTVTNECSLGSAQNGCTNRHCRIEFSGRSPMMTVGTYMTIARTATLEFIVPEEGYAATPLTIGGKLNIAANCRIIVDAERFRQGIGRKEKVVLATFAGSDEVSAEALEASNALLGEGLALSVENKQLILTAKRSYGFRLMIR